MDITIPTLETVWSKLSEMKELLLCSRECQSWLSPLYPGWSGRTSQSLRKINCRFALMFYANSWGRLLAMEPGEKDVKLKHILLGGVFSQLVIAPTVTVRSQTCISQD